MAKLLTKMFLKSELLKDGRLRCIVPPCRAGNFFLYSYLLLSLRTQLRNYVVDICSACSHVKKDWGLRLGLSSKVCAELIHIISILIF